MNEFDAAFAGAFDDLMETFGDPITYHPQDGGVVTKNLHGGDLRGEYRDGGHDVDDGEGAVRVAMKTIEVNQADLQDGYRFKLGDRITHETGQYQLSEEVDRTDNLYRFSLKRV